MFAGESPIQSEQKPARIVAIAASLGGLDALSVIFRDLPANFAASILVVLHVSPDGPRLAAGILSTKTDLVVTYAQSGDMPIVGHVYLAPPDFHLTVESGGKMALNSGPKIHHSRPAANPLFETVATVYGSSAIGMVLTGGDSDGADGLAAITGAGGIGIVQAPKDARDPDMPMAAIRNDHPTYVLSLDSIGKRLLDLVDRPV